MATQPTERKEGRRTSEFAISQLTIIGSLLLPVVLSLLDKYVASQPPNSMMAVVGAGVAAFGYSIASAIRKKAILEADTASLKQPETITAGGDVTLSTQTGDPVAPPLEATQEDDELPNVDSE